MDALTGHIGTVAKALKAGDPRMVGFFGDRAKEAQGDSLGAAWNVVADLEDLAPGSAEALALSINTEPAVA